MSRDRTREASMLASMQTFMNGLTSWLPDKLVHPAEILLYFAILGTMSVIPLIAWLGWVVATTDREQKA